MPWYYFISNHKDRELFLSGHMDIAGDKMAVKQTQYNALSNKI